MSDVPTFGREDLAEEDKPTWDYWEALWKRRFQPAEPTISEDDMQLDHAETVVFNALRALACQTGAVDPIDPEDCASVAAEAVRALRAAGYALRT